MATYRGIKVTPENTYVEKAKAQPGIYRGTKHDAEPSKSTKASHGIYRGIKWTD
tara:strand:+ start:1150 stop:1311 length:162 start_codon:yes stop_codon:yes gene_type:complete